MHYATNETFRVKTRKEFDSIVERILENVDQIRALRINDPWQIVHVADISASRRCEMCVNDHANRIVAAPKTNRWKA